jgi:dTDP-4-dehydrorhamnose 3,5-epimerase
VFVQCGRDAADVSAVTAAEYGVGKALAPRPRHSALNLTKIEATGFTPAPWPQRLAEYLAAAGGDTSG